MVSVTLSNLSQDHLRGKMVQFKVRIIESISRNILVDTDSKESAAGKVLALSAEELEKWRAVEYDAEIKFVSETPFEDWPYLP